MTKAATRAQGFASSPSIMNNLKGAKKVGNFSWGLSKLWGCGAEPGMTGRVTLPRQTGPGATFVMRPLS